MKSHSVIFLLLAVSCTTYGSPANLMSLPFLRQTSQFDVFGNTVKLIEELVANLRKSAEHASSAVGTFTSGVEAQAKQCRLKLEADLQKLRASVQSAIQSISDRVSASGSVIKECITSHRIEAEALLTESMAKTTSCADDRLKEAGQLISGLSTISHSAQEFTTMAFAEAKNCTTVNTASILTVGQCLGRVALKTEMEGAVFFTQSGVSIARINLYMATLPAALEVCAGTGLVDAGFGTARIVMDIASCSATDVFSTFTASSSSGSPVASVISAATSGISAISASADSILGSE